MSQRLISHPKTQKANTFVLAFCFEAFGSPTWARTRDLRINSPALYQLSYRGTAEKRDSMEWVLCCQALGAPFFGFSRLVSTWHLRCVLTRHTLPFAIESIERIRTRQANRSAYEQVQLVLHILEFFGFGQRGLRLCDARPVLRQISIERDERLLVTRNILFGVDRIDRALGHADSAVDALVRVDRQEVRAFAEAIHRAYIDAIGIAAFDAAFGHNVSHANSCKTVGAVNGISRKPTL
ncbi:conserved protein of unknown function [Pararobbsia alpina]